MNPALRSQMLHREPELPPRRHALCTPCLIFRSCPHDADFVPNDSTKLCFFNNPKISNPKGDLPIKSPGQRIVDAFVDEIAASMPTAVTCGQFDLLRRVVAKAGLGHIELLWSEGHVVGAELKP